MVHAALPLQWCREDWISVPIPTDSGGLGRLLPDGLVVPAFRWAAMLKYVRLLTLLTVKVKFLVMIDLSDNLLCQLCKKKEKL